MTLRHECRERAKQEVFRRKCAAEKAAQEFCDAVYVKYPDILEMQKVKDSLSKNLIDSVIAGKSREEIDTTMEKGAEVSAGIKEALCNVGLNLTDLKPKYFCTVCSDTGLAEGKDCTCLTELQKRYICDSFSGSYIFKDCSFSTFSLNYYSNERESGGFSPLSQMRTVFKYCQDYADNFTLLSKGIFMMGNTGLGKTHLSMAIANEVSKKGYGVIYGSAQNLLSKIESEHFGRAEGNTMEELQKCDLLIFDDLGTEFQSQFIVSVVYNLINTRILNGLPTIINTNLSLGEICSTYSDRIVSRISYYYDMLHFVGKDIRIMKKSGSK